MPQLVDLRLPARPSVLLVTNHADTSTCPGQVDGLDLLVASGELAAADVIHAGHKPDEPPRDQVVVEAIAASPADVIIVLSMKSRITDLEGVRRAVAGRPLLYWEGDCWGRGKPIGPQMAAWLDMADVVFSVGGPPQTQLLTQSGARRIVPTIHTYDHILFAASEESPPSPASTHSACFLGSNLMRVPLVTGVPGSYQRREVVRRLRRHFRSGFLLGGLGWPRSWSVGYVPFAEQDRFFQRARVVANWDHYPRTHGYTSDRTAIAMIAGRPQVTTKHPAMGWLPDATHGLFLEQTPAAVVDRVRVLTAGDAQDAGVAAHEWAKHRISHREAMRYMMSCVCPEVEPPPAHPWSLLD